MQYLKSKLKQLYLSDAVRRVLHTFWQAAGGALVAGLVASRSTTDVKLTVATAVAAGLAALKALAVK